MFWEGESRFARQAVLTVNEAITEFVSLAIIMEGPLNSLSILSI